MNEIPRLERKLGDNIMSKEVEIQNLDNPLVDQIFYTITYVEEDEFEYAHCIHIFLDTKTFKVTNNIPVRHLKHYYEYDKKHHAHYLEHIVFDALYDGLIQKGFKEIDV